MKYTIDNEEVTYKQWTAAPVDGVHKAYFLSGQLAYRVPYLNGQEHGIKEEYYNNGQLKYRIPYINGQEHGIEELYYSNGSLLRTFPFVCGKKHGIQKAYLMDGQLFTKTPWVNDIQRLDLLNPENKLLLLTLLGKEIE